MSQPSPNSQSDPEPDQSQPTGGRSGKDYFGPPKEPCECYCLHCGRVFMSDGIWWQKIIGATDGFDGKWMCPTPNCDGAGFTFDIYPTDPNHPDNSGWCFFDDDDDECDELSDCETESNEWDPDESKYAELDEIFGEVDDDLDGEEWKHGLQPGERPPEPPWVAEARRHHEEEQKKYDGPDLRPREIQAEPQEPRKPLQPGEEDDIPF